MRTFLAICLVSAIVHIALLLAVAVPYQRQTAHGETMSVELVPSSEAPSFNEGPASDDKKMEQQAAASPKAEPVPDFSKLRLSDTPKMPQDDQKQSSAPPPEQQQSRQQAQRPQGPAAAQQPAQQQQPMPQQQAMTPQPAPAPAPQELPDLPKIAPEMAVETPADQYERLAALMNIPSAVHGPDAYGTEADTKAKLESDDIAKFKAHLKTCWKLPPGVTENDKVRILIRIALLPNGALAAQPELIGGPSAVSAASEFVLPVYKNAVAALKQCAPYSMLPRDRYKEWRVLDINFSPDEMPRG